MGLLDSLNKAQEEENLAKELAITNRLSQNENQAADVIPHFYKDVVSLGFNCETSFKILAHFNTLSSYPYSWAYCQDRELFLESLKNMRSILSEEVEFLPDTNMIKCKKYNISFHIKARRDELKTRTGVLNDEACSEALNELRSRFNHLVDKMESLFKYGSNTLFIYKLKFTNDTDNDIDFIKRLIDTLNELYVSKRYTLLVVVEAAHAYKFTPPEDPHIKIATVPNFTSIYNVQEQECETLSEGWKEIADEYFSKVITV